MLMNNEIENIKNIILQTVKCKKIYLFGSYAYGTPHESSDYDFFIVVSDDNEKLTDITDNIYFALYKKTNKKPVDILVRKASDFENRKSLMTLENEIFNKGVILYDEQ